MSEEASGCTGVELKGGSLVYTKNMKHEKWEGKGRLLYPQDDARGRVLYEGGFKDGKRQGKGKLTWKNGCIYKGNWNEDMMEGQGCMKWPTGQVYRGSWYNNQMQGEGIMTWQNPQVRYVGSWWNGKRSGNGRITFADTDEAERVFYEGSWVNDRKEGWGEMCWKSGSFYKGEWKAGLREGWGVHHFHNGDKYVGSWARDKRMGKGELQFANGDKFEGEWIEDKKHGKGTYIYAHGRVRYETWAHGVKVEGASSVPVVQSLLVLCVEFVGNHPGLLCAKKNGHSAKKGSLISRIMIFDFLRRKDHKELPIEAAKDENDAKDERSILKSSLPLPADALELLEAFLHRTKEHGEEKEKKKKLSCITQ